MKLYRKLTAICLTAALAVGMAVTASADVSPVSVTVNGETASTSAYINSDWRTMVPAETAKALTEKPAKRWDGLVDKLIYAAALAVVAWIAAGMPGLG